MSERETGAQGSVVLFDRPIPTTTAHHHHHPSPLTPSRFMDSELELHQEIQQMNIIATAPSLYPVVIKGGHVATLVSLFAHENSDIVVAVIDLLQEMTDTDALEDNSDSAAELIEELVWLGREEGEGTETA